MVWEEGYDMAYMWGWFSPFTFHEAWGIKFGLNVKNTARKLNQHPHIQTTNYNRKMHSVHFNMAFVTLSKHVLATQ